ISAECEAWQKKPESWIGRPPFQIHGEVRDLAYAITERNDWSLRYVPEGKFIKHRLLKYLAKARFEESLTEFSQAFATTKTKFFEEESSVAKRLAGYRAVVDELTCMLKDPAPMVNKLFADFQKIPINNARTLDGQAITTASLTENLDEHFVK